VQSLKTLSLTFLHLKSINKPDKNNPRKWYEQRLR